MPQSCTNCGNIKEAIEGRFTNHMMPSSFLLRVGIFILVHAGIGVSGLAVV
jgi:hypothetical protein